VVLTVFFAYMSSSITLSYELPKILPSSDPHFVQYESFKKKYGEDGNVMVIALKSDKMFTLSFFQEWYDLSQTLKNKKGVKNVLSLANLTTLKRNDIEKKFDIVPILSGRPSTQSDIDSLKSKLARLPFYDQFIYNGDAHLMAITFDQAVINSKERITLTNELQKIALDFSKSAAVDLHFSGMPFIRTNFMSKVRDELVLFMGLAFLVTTLILFLFFRSFSTVFYAISVVLIGVIWSIGFMSLFDYQISVLTGLIPPLIIIIGIPNTIFLINKYQEEYVKTSDKMKALSITIEKIGKTTFLANVTTCIGFFVFYFTNSPLLSEFGLVAAICVMATWIISLILIPTIFSLVGAPNSKNMRHLDNKTISKMLAWVQHIVATKRTYTYWFVGFLVLISIIGMYKIKAIGYVVDDLPKKDQIYTDLKFVETNFKGVVPIEVNVDTKNPNGIFDPIVLNKIKNLQKEFAKYPEFTKPISIVEGLKFIYQAYRGGDPKYYVLPPALELQNLAAYVADKKGSTNMLSSFMDADKKMTRVSFQSADVGTVRTEELFNKLQPKIDSIFNYDRETESWKAKADRVEANLTGNGIVFTKGNNYLLKNLRESSLLAILLVCLVMATQFFNVRTILISTLPSIIPLLITAGIMGYFAIPLKPSTILIFSISFGIASDGTIYFLTRYKEELERGHSISVAVSETIKYTGLSMLYTAFILFFGFGIFIASGFKGTFFLGLLISITLFIGMISNLILLPCFLLTLDKRARRKS
jgi:uncharacterized protein